MDGEEPMTFMMLPNDLALKCLARVSRLYYPTLSLVSKRFRSLLSSTELYQYRNLLSRTESCLYVCFNYPNSRQNSSSRQRWFTLCQRPNSSKKFLVPITSPNSPSTYQSAFASFGSNIYAISGITYDVPASSSVMVMDCRSQTWSEAPNMQVAREFPSACVLNDKIYVTGGCEDLDATNWMEVFDTTTQTWEFESSFPGGFKYQGVGYDGNVYVKYFEKHVTYKPNKSRWRAGDLAMDWGWYCSSSSSYCVIENVLYSCRKGMIRWFNSDERMWTYLKGLESLANLFALPRNVLAAKVTNYGGKLMVLWEEIVIINKCHKENLIWCAEIALEKHQGNIWGTLEWYDVVKTVTKPYEYVVPHILAVTL